jgi:hypothetical protein
MSMAALISPLLHPMVEGVDARLLLDWIGHE